MFTPRQHTNTATQNYGHTSFVQPKLNIEKPGDKHEGEAEKSTDPTVSKEKGNSSSFLAPAANTNASPTSFLQAAPKPQGTTAKPNAEEDTQEVAVAEETTQEQQNVSKSVDAPAETATKSTEGKAGEAGTKQKGETPTKTTAPAPKGGGGGGGSASASSAQSEGGGQSEGEGESEKEAVELPTENTKVYTDNLIAQQPIAFTKSMKQADQDVLKAQTSEQEGVKESLPEIEQPTGIPLKSAAAATKKEKANQQATQLQGTQETAPDMAPEGKKEGENIEEKSVQPPSSFMQKIKSFFSFSLFGGGDGSAEKTKVKDSIKSLPTSESVDTDPGEKPQVDLTGQADPNKNQQNVTESDESVNKEQLKNIEESKVYKGENDIYPEMQLEMLSPSTDFSEIKANTALDDEIPKVSSEVAQSFDASAKAHMDQELAAEKAKQDEAYTKMEADQAKEHELATTKIDAETARVKTEQEAAQNEAKGEVGKQRAQWQKENEAVRNDFSTKSSKAKEQVDKDIDTKTTETDTKINAEYTKAKTEGDKEVQKANTEAERKKESAKKESEQKSWWDRAVDAVSSFFDALKSALNAIFDGLRALVKGLIEAAKKLANTLIDLARDAIIGMIKAFGELLKGFVNIALAAFPEIRDRINNAIDSAVDKATNLVNQLAEGLKKAVNALLDALGAVLDAILAAYQALYNLLLDALKFLVIGLLKVLEFLWNLVEGAWYAPGEFLGAMAKETMGGDPSKPLDNFEVPAGQEANWAQAMGLSEGQTAMGDAEAQTKEEIPDELMSVLTKDELATSDLTLEPNPAVELSPELIAQVMQNPDGTIELGGAGGDAITTKEFQASAADASGIDVNNIVGDSAEQTGDSVANTDAANYPAAGGGGGADASAAGPDWKNMSDDQKLDHYLNQMLQPTQEEASKQPAPTTQKPQPSVDNSPEVLITKTGRLSVGTRLAFMGNQMLNGIKMMWNKHKAWIIGILVAALLAAGVIAFFTGGAGLAVAVDIIVKAMIVIFGAVAVYKALGHIWDYVKYAWAGDSKKAGQSLAMAFAVIVVEFFLDKILLGMAKVFKKIAAAAKAAVKSALKATKAGRKVLKGINNARRFAQTTVRKGIAKIKNSKLVVNLKGKLGKGAKKFDDLRNRILERFKFKRMWFEKKGRRIELWAEFNPEFKLLSSDEVVNADNRRSGTSAPQWKRMPDGSYKVKRPGEGWRKAERIGRDPVPQWVNDHPDFDYAQYYLRRGDIESSYTGSRAANEEIHHLTTMENLNHDVTRKAVREGNFEINNASVNGEKVSRFSSEVRTKDVDGSDVVKASPSGTHASHPNYTEGQRQLLNRFNNEFPNATGAEAARFLEEMNKKLRTSIRGLQPGEVVDQIFKVKKYKTDGLHTVSEFYDDVISNL